jgi:hypothetical protein
LSRQELLLLEHAPAGGLRRLMLRQELLAGTGLELQPLGFETRGTVLLQ